jgi:hypothetical protein
MQARLEKLNAVIRANNGIWGFSSWEEETILKESVQAFINNYARHNQHFSYAGKNLRSSSRLVDNAGAFSSLIKSGLLAVSTTSIEPSDPAKIMMEGDQYVVIIPTEKMLVALERHFGI